MHKAQDNFYEVGPDADYSICLADLVFHSRKICMEKGIEYDPYNVGLTADGGNLLIYLFSDENLKTGVTLDCSAKI